SQAGGFVPCDLASIPGEDYRWCLKPGRGGLYLATMPPAMCQPRLTCLKPGRGPCTLRLLRRVRVAPIAVLSQARQEVSYPATRRRRGRPTTRRWYQDWVTHESPEDTPCVSNRAWLLSSTVGRD